MTKARYVMVGGFLGAGKTTALLRLAERYTARGLRVGLITNDQSVGLVDTAMLGAHDFPVVEITGGCFCCRFNSLTEAAAKLAREQRPDVFLAEPVGSCTDLAATVAYPLRRMYGDEFTVAPYSVLVDPVRAERILGLAPGKSFSPKVVYIYLKQLEEADIIVVNKTDLLDAGRLDALTRTLAGRFKGTVVAVSARAGTNIDTWADLIDGGEPAGGTAMDVDYDTYAEGEALLGWVNLTAGLEAVQPFDGNAFLTAAVSDLHARVAGEGVEIAHLKLTLSPDEGTDIGVINLVRTGGRGELSHALQDLLGSAVLLLNLRAEADPECLKAAALASLAGVSEPQGVTCNVEHVEAFRPGRPVPTHRLTRA